MSGGLRFHSEGSAHVGSVQACDGLTAVKKPGTRVRGFWKFPERSRKLLIELQERSSEGK